MKRLSKKYRINSNSPLINYRKAAVNILGLNSGTSGDGLDAALVRFEKTGVPRVLKCKTFKYSPSLQKRIIAAGELDFNDGIEWLRLDLDLGQIMGKMSFKFLQQLKASRLHVDFIASHGQTVRHLPSTRGRSITLQIGEPSLIAGQTSLSVISDFRRSDIAAGGQGAPLSPILHEKLFRSKDKWRAIVNIGGIANITLLPAPNSRKKPLASDCGPGNMAIDKAMNNLFNKPYDQDGQTALRGLPRKDIVDDVLAMPYFSAKLPKSTGRELFGDNFYNLVFDRMSSSDPADIVSTFSEITVLGIARFIKRYSAKIDEIYLCGGGSKNDYISARLEGHFPNTKIKSTSALGFDPDYLEAVLWAYLGYCFVRQIPVDTGYFTGAKRKYIPGKICLP